MHKNFKVKVSAYMLRKILDFIKGLFKKDPLILVNKNMDKVNNVKNNKNCNINITNIGEKNE